MILESTFYFNKSWGTPWGPSSAWSHFQGKYKLYLSSIKEKCWCLKWGMHVGDFTHRGTQKASQTYLQTMFPNSCSHSGRSHTTLLSSSRPFFLYMHDTHHPGPWPTLIPGPGRAEGPRRVTPPSSTFTPPLGSHFVVSSSLALLNLGETLREHFPLITIHASALSSQNQTGQRKSRHKTSTKKIHKDSPQKNWGQWRTTLNSPGKRIQNGLVEQKFLLAAKDREWLGREQKYLPCCSLNGRKTGWAQEIRLCSKNDVVGCTLMFTAALFTIAKSRNHPPQVSVNRWMGKQNVGYPDNGIVSNLKEEGHPVTRKNTQEPQGYYGKWNKPVSHKKTKPCMIPLMWGA